MKVLMSMGKASGLLHSHELFNTPGWDIIIFAVAKNVLLTLQRKNIFKLL